MFHPEKLVFVLGAPRSGTTWLQILMSQSDAIVSCQETHLFSSYMDSLFSSAENFATDARGVGLTRIISEERFLDLCRDLADGALAEIAKTKPAAHIFLEKTPANIYIYQNILKLYPNSYFIEIVRDPRAVVASMRAVDFGNWTPAGVIANLQRWTDAVAKGRALEARAMHHMRVRYEDLLSDTESILRDIFAFLGECPADDDLRRWVEASSFNQLKNRPEETKAPWDLTSEPKNFYRKGEAESWKDDLTQAQVALIEHLAREDMRQLGYQPASSGTAIAWRPWMYNMFDAAIRRFEWYKKKL